jgi:hypothetical protein
VVRPLLIRGMVVGLLAGLAAFLVAKLFGESAVGQAIGFETARNAAEGHPDGPALVSRTVQSTIGLLTGTVVYGVAVGGSYALGYACVQGRVGSLGARTTAAVTAIGGFVGLYLLPFLKYPANPPSIGNPDTIGRRTSLYLLLVLLSLLVVVGCAVAARQLAPRYGAWNGALIAVAIGAAEMAVCYLVLPAVHETPAGFPADVLWRFRLASLGIQTATWLTLGLVFGALTERSMRRATPPDREMSVSSLVG